MLKEKRQEDYKELVKNTANEFLEITEKVITKVLFFFGITK
jgi:hypothetical protein